MSIEGRTYTVTGAAAGIGRSCAVALAEAGAKGLVLVDRDEEALQEVASLTEAAGADVRTLVGDVRSRDLPEAMVSSALAAWGALDGAVNNAGVQGPTTLLRDTSDEDWDWVLGINLNATFRCVRAQMRHMCDRGHGSIVNISSATTLGVWSSMGAYCASKFGVNGLSKVASKEGAPHGVRVNAVAPGITQTPLMETWREEHGHSMDDLRTRVPLGRLGSPAEIAAAATWLLTDAASFVTGALIPVEGGRTG